MDAYEASRIVFSRIQNMDPENATKIMGLLLIKDQGENEMIRLAFGSETQLYSVVLKARNELGLSLNSSSAPPPPCLYFARGYCKNRTSCRFVHGSNSEERLAASASAPATSLLMANSFPYSPRNCINYDTQRVLMMGEEDMHRFGRSRLECSGMVTPSSSKQIYLTFPADSAFREEHVSNYFSIYGPVQDVRIPYQQKRMFGFVTFLYPETVKLILAKGNPHFVCDARVLVKPYKEKVKVPEQNRKQQQQHERIEVLSPCSTLTSLDSRDPLDLQLGGARGFCNSQDMLWRRKLEEQVDLQEAIELQGRRLMGLQLLDWKKPFDNSNLSSSPRLKSPTTTDHSLNIFSTQFPSDCIRLSRENCSIPPNDQNGYGNESAPPPGDSDPQESACSFEHYLPDSPFASPTKNSTGEFASLFSEAMNEAETETTTMSSSAFVSNDTNIASSLLLTGSTLDMASFKSYYFPMPGFPPTHETIGM